MTSMVHERESHVPVRFVEITADTSRGDLCTAASTERSNTMVSSFDRDAFIDAVRDMDEELQIELHDVLLKILISPRETRGKAYDLLPPLLQKINERWRTAPMTDM